MKHLVDDIFLDAFHALGAPDGEKFGARPAKKLSMLIRPAFIAEPRHTLLWGDWSAIEARVLPWLAASPGAERKLDIFRANDKDPSRPDIYIATACELTGEDPEEMWEAYQTKGHPRRDEAKKLRQAQGKVPELSLGFGGGLGALQAMATNYGVYFDEASAREMVSGWREANGWARSFWGSHGRNGSYGLWGAINSAIENPDTVYPIGRVAYVYDRSYMGGTVFCALPDGGLLTYPGIKWEWREVEDKKTGEIEDKYQLTFVKGYGRVALWYGKQAENITQAVAARILRRTLKRLDRAKSRDLGPCRVWMPVVMHTHDEAVLEVSEDMVEFARPQLLYEMERNDDWDEGLPLKAEISQSWYYTKALD